MESSNQFSDEAEMTIQFNTAYVKEQLHYACI